MAAPLALHFKKFGAVRPGLQAASAGSCATPLARLQSQRPPAFSAGQGDVMPLEVALSTLLSTSGTGGRWALTRDGAGLERTFKFKTFAKTWVR